MIELVVRPRWQNVYMITDALRASEAPAPKIVSVLARASTYTISRIPRSFILEILTKLAQNAGPTIACYIGVLYDGLDMRAARALLTIRRHETAT